MGGVGVYKNKKVERKKERKKNAVGLKKFVNESVAIQTAIYVR